MLRLTIVEIARLDLQHWLLRDGFYGGKELVFAPLDLSKPPHTADKWQILDSACGTGVWAVELASKYPQTTEFTLLDYNTGPCKHRNPQLPENARLEQFNLLTDFDNHPEFANRFDFAHQRLLVFAFPAAQWKAVLKGYFAALKPGGYIQLAEFEPAEARMGAHMETLKRLIQEISVPRGIHPESIAKDVEQWLKEVGFEEVKVDRAYLPYMEDIPNPPVPDAVAAWGKDTVTAVAAPALKMGKISQEEHDEMHRGLMEEFRNPKPEHRFSMVSLVARVSWKLTQL